MRADHRHLSAIEIPFMIGQHKWNKILDCGRVYRGTMSTFNSSVATIRIARKASTVPALSRTAAACGKFHVRRYVRRRASALAVYAAVLAAGARRQGRLSRSRLCDLGNGASRAQPSVSHLRWSSWTCLVVSVINRVEVVWSKA